MKSLNIPIVVMSFNRPGFLEETLRTLRHQTGFDPDRYNIHLFQDGAVNRWSGMQYAEQTDIDACMRVFKEQFPQGIVHHPGDNIGICENFWSAESFVFNELGADVAWFFEDDMILSPVFFEMMLKLDDFARYTSTISYYSAYGNYYASAQEIAANLRAIIPLDHHWAFGIRRTAWRRMQPALEGYYSIVRGSDYSRRDHRAVFRYFADSGFVPRGSSQDAAKTWACARLGLVRLRTFAPYARYIGTQGAHMTPEKFDELGFSRTTILDNAIDNLQLPSGSDLLNSVDDQRRALYNIYKQEYRDLEASLPSLKMNPLRLATSDDVITAYLLFLHRLPRSQSVIDMHNGVTPVHHLVKYITSSTEYVSLTQGTTKPRLLDPSRAIRLDELRKLYNLLLHREADVGANLDRRAGVTSVSDNVSILHSSAEYQKIDRLISNGAATRRSKSALTSTPL